MESTSIKKNTVMNLILTVSSVVFPLISYKYATGFLLPSGIGRVSFVTSLIAYFSMFAQLGIPSYGIREVAGCRTDRAELGRLVKELILIGLGMSLISYLFLFFLVSFVPELQSEKMLLLVISPTIIFNILGVEWLYKGLEKYSYLTIVHLVFKIIALTAVLLIVHSKEDLAVYAFLTVFAGLASNLVNFFYAGKLVDVTTGKLNLKRHLKPVLLFFAMTCTITIYTYLDTVMLGFMVSDSEVGYYDVAVKVKEILVWVVTALGAVTLPRASYYAEHQMEKEHRNVVRDNFKFVFLTAVPLIFFFFIFAREIVCLISGETFLSAVPALRILLPTIILIGLTNAMGMQILIPTKREKLVLYSVLIGAGTDVILNAVLIPTYGIVGAAIGTLMAEVVVLLVQVILLRKELLLFMQGSFDWRLLAALIPPAVAAALCLKLNLESMVCMCVTFVLSAAAYFASLHLLKVIDITEVVSIKDLDLKKAFLFIFAFYVAIRFFRDTMFFAGNDAALEVLNLAKLVLAGLAAIKLLLDIIGGKFTKTEVLLMALVGVFLSLTAILTGVEELLIFWIFICAAHDCSHREICRISGIAMLAVVILAFTASMTGLIENTMTWRGDYSHFREGCGFLKPYMAAHYCFFAVVTYLYSRSNKVTWVELLLTAVLQVLVFLHAKTKNPFVIGLIYALLCMLNKCGTFERVSCFLYEKKILKILGALVIFLCAAFPLVLTAGYDPANGFYVFLNRVLSTRLNLGQNALKTYGIPLLGQTIVWSAEENYNIVDSSFVNILVNYGVIFFALLLSALSALGYIAGKRKDISFLIMLLAISLHSMFDCYLLMLYCNLLLMGVSYFKNNPPVLVKDIGMGEMS